MKLNRVLHLTLATLAVGMSLLVVQRARAIDDPHALSYNVRCSSCHATHSAAGANLTTASSNEALCLSCHSTASGNQFPIDGFMKADPVVGVGSSHAWNVDAINSTLGVQAPQNAAMQSGMDNGKIICSTCHNQHHSDPGAVTAGLAGQQVKSLNADHLVGSGTGVASLSATSTASARTYLLEIVVPGAAGAATFRLSNDGGLSWFGWNGAAWVGYDVATAPARLTGTDVALNDGANARVTFTGATAPSFTTGDRYRVAVSYPFLRVALDAGDNANGTKFCRDCHRDRAMDHVQINVWNGQRKSHPVGVSLNANLLGTDRSVPLDANGAAQSGGADQDGNPANNLVLASDNTVQCLTCHAVHGADGNSNTQ